MQENLIGRKIKGKFLIVKELGRGAFGVVYLAKGPKNEEIALKIINPAHIENRDIKDKIIKSFMDEADNTKRLTHKNIVSVKEYSRDGDIFYIALEYLPNNLDEYLKKFTLTIGQVVEFIKKISDGLRYAHLEGFVHRDLKPANIMISADGEPKIVDFGLAKTILLATNNVSREIAGTLVYMAPEQFINSAKINHQADIYSLALIAYQALCGYHPYMPIPLSENSNSFLINGKTVTATDGNQLTDAIVAAITRDIPPKASSINPDLPSFVDDVLFMGLEKHYNDRYDSAVEFVEDLNKAFEGKPTTAYLKYQEQQKNEIIYLDQEHINTWEKRGRDKDETRREQFLLATAFLAIAGLGKFLYDKYNNFTNVDLPQLELRERVRVYIIVAEFLEREITGGRLDIFITTLRLMGGDDLDISKILPPDKIDALKTQNTSILNYARKMLVSVKMLYRLINSSKATVATTEIYYRNKDNNSKINRMVVREELQWKNLPSDIRQDLLNKQNDVTYLIYPL